MSGFFGSADECQHWQMSTGVLWHCQMRVRSYSKARGLRIYLNKMSCVNAQSDLSKNTYFDPSSRTTGRMYLVFLVR